MGVKRFEVYLCVLDPTVGSEIRKRRPCVVISPDDLNETLHTFIAAPMTTSGKPYPSRIPCAFDGRPGRVALDQIRSLDQRRIIRKLGSLSEADATAVLGGLEALFAP